MTKQSIEERFDAFYRKNKMEIEERYYVKLEAFISQELSQARREEREKVKDILVKLKEKDKGWTGFPPTPMRFGEYEKIQASKDFGYDKAIGDVLDQLKLKVKEEK